jgi:septum formation protein
MIFPELILASQSPRRKDLLERAGLRFRVHVPSTPELPAPDRIKKETPAEIVKKISAAKAHACSEELNNAPNTIILSADTLVFLGKKVLSKPSDEKQARAMLQSLSGKWHSVYTGVSCLQNQEKKKQKVKSIFIETRVQFFPLTKKQIDWYLSTGEPMDKAGAYGAQGYGSTLVKAYSGSYTNVVGLPLGESLRLLEKISQIPWQSWQ